MTTSSNSEDVGFRFKSEKTWVDQRTGYACEITACSLGWRCGFVTITKDHACFEKHYNDIIFADVDVHNDISFSDYQGLDQKFWKLGFHTNGFFDAYDPEILKDFGVEFEGTIFEEYFQFKVADEFQKVRTFDYCAREVEHLAFQLKKIDDEAKKNAGI